MRRTDFILVALAWASLSAARAATGAPLSVEFQNPECDPKTGAIHVAGKVLLPGWRLMIDQHYVTLGEDKTFRLTLPNPLSPSPIPTASGASGGELPREILWYAVSHAGEVQKGAITLQRVDSANHRPGTTEWKLSFRFGLSPYHSLNFSTLQLGTYQSAGSQPLAAETSFGVDWGIKEHGRWRLQAQLSGFYQASVFGDPNYNTSTGAVVLPVQSRTQTSYLDSSLRFIRQGILLNRTSPLRLSLGAELQHSSTLSDAANPIGYGTAYFVGIPIALSWQAPETSALGTLEMEGTPQLSVTPWNGLSPNALQLRLRWKPLRLFGIKPPLQAHNWSLEDTRTALTLSTSPQTRDQVARESLVAWFGFDW